MSDKFELILKRINNLEIAVTRLASTVVQPAGRDLSNLFNSIIGDIKSEYLDKLLNLTLNVNNSNSSTAGFIDFVVSNKLEHKLIETIKQIHFGKLHVTCHIPTIELIEDYGYKIRLSMMLHGELYHTTYSIGQLLSQVNMIHLHVDHMKSVGVFSMVDQIIHSLSKLTLPYAKAKLSTQLLEDTIDGKLNNKYVISDDGVSINVKLDDVDFITLKNSRGNTRRSLNTVLTFDLYLSLYDDKLLIDTKYDELLSVYGPSDN